MSGPAPLTEVLDILRGRQDDARAIGIEFVGVVGSLARGEANPDSDADVIVKHLGGAGAFELIRFEEHLKHVLRRPVDLIFSEAMSPARRAYIERDLVLL